MRKFGLVAGVATFVLGWGMSTSAYAQDALPVQKPFRVKIGGLFPTDAAVRDAIGNNLIFVGLGYDFSKTTSTSPTIIEAYFDYANKSDTRNVPIETGSGQLIDNIRSKATGTVYGVGVAARYLFSPPTTPTQAYAGAGVGIYNVQYKETNSLQGESESFSESKTGLGGKLFAGIQSNAGFFGEIEYNLFPTLTFTDDFGDEPTNVDVKTNGFALRIGYRF